MPPNKNILHIDYPPKVSVPGALSINQDASATCCDPRHSARKAVANVHQFILLGESQGGAGEAGPTDDWSGLGRQRSNNYSYGKL
jgi:hypothetical protein